MASAFPAVLLVTKAELPLAVPVYVKKDSVPLTDTVMPDGALDTKVEYVEPELKSKFAKFVCANNLLEKDSKATNNTNFNLNVVFISFRF